MADDNFLYRRWAEKATQERVDKEPLFAVEVCGLEAWGIMGGNKTQEESGGGGGGYAGFNNTSVWDL